LHKGDSAHFQLFSDCEQGDLPEPLTEAAYQNLLHQTLHYWYRWLSQCTYQGRWREMVQRSALALKLLTYGPTGAIVAAPTTSLPEALGGMRNWDYRYTWLRDAAFTLDSLLKLGFTEEAEAFTGWLNERCNELKENGTLQPMYGIAGEHNLQEMTLDHLAGYRGSRPVRIGNGAYRQKQLDIYGELMDAIYIYNNYDAISYSLWQNLCHLLNWLSEHWQESDQGIWEVRGGEKPFLHSRLMCWVAFDRALRIARDWGWPAPLITWEQIRAKIYHQIMQEGWNAQRNCFTQYYGSDAVDASTLLLLLKKFTGPREPRLVTMIERIKEELTVGTTTVRRYDQRSAADDGMDHSEEGAFTACCFWMIENLGRIGKVEDARMRLEKLLSMSNHVGLYAEEISSGVRAVGNFPQAFSHLALITACYALDETLNTRKGWYWRE
jgi:GH15 family glucan-1,4-alpha-glucosidase